MHRSQILLYLTLAFIVGVFAGSFFPISQKTVWIGSAVFAGLIAVFFRRDSKVLNPGIVFFAFLGLFLLFGVGRFNSFNPRQHILEKLAQASAELRNVSGENRFKVAIFGYLDEEPDIRGDSQRLVFKSKVLQSGKRFLPTDESVLVTTGLYPSYGYGQKLVISGELILPQNFSDDRDHNFDYVKYLAKDRIYTLMRYPDIAEAGGLKLDFWERTKVSFYGKIFAVRRVFENSVKRSLAEPNAAFIGGILLGARSQIPEDLKAAFNRTGTTHILAISGYNITIIAGIISWILLAFLRRQTAFWFSVAGIVVFTILTGAQASVIRAAIMGGLLLYAQKEGRLYGAANGVVFAGAAMVLINPGILRFDIGFQLSFMATLGLIYLAPVLEEKFKTLAGWLPEFFKIRENLTMSISAQIFVLPMILYYFKNLSLVSIPANILILPLIPATMLLGFVTGLAGMIFGPLGQIAGYFTWLLSSLELAVIKILGRPVFAAVTVKFPWYLVALAYGIILSVLWRGPASGHKTET